MQGLGINPWILLAQIVNFVALVVILRAVAYEPVQNILKARQEKAEQTKKDAEAAAEARANIETERENTIEKAREEARAIVAEARERASTLKEQIIQEAKVEAEETVREARQEAEEERNRILGEMRGQIAALATSAAQRIIGEKLDEQRQRALVDSFFSGVRDGRVQVLPEEMEPADGAVTVTSAIPLVGEERDIVRRELTERLGGDVELSFRVDPEILGGLVVRVGDRVMDGSVVGQLERLQETLV